jgi:O-antigen ligase
LLEGKGLGNYFQFHSSTGTLITTMLHNQYVQLIYQVGVIGLILYVIFVVHTLRRLRKTYLETMDLSYQLISLVAFTVLLGASAYYVAYDFEPFTWMYIGIGMSVAQSHRDEKLAQYEVAYSYYPMSGG